MPLLLRKLRHVAFLIAALLCSAAAPAALPAGVTQRASVEGITEYALGNGLRVLLFPDPAQARTVVNMTYLVGSRHENYGETGMAHLLEHMTFKGTATSGNYWEQMRKRGMNNNGTTWVDRTNYFVTFNPSDADLEWALAMEADRMVNSLIAKADLDTEMTVVRNEMERAENSPQRVLNARMLSAMYRWHSYGKDTLGARSDVEGVDVVRLQAFYRTHYQPDNAVLLVAGAFDPDQALAWIARYFGPIPRPSRALPRLYTVEPVQDGERSVTVRRVGDAQLLVAAYRTVPAAHPDFVAVDALADLMTLAPSGRLHRALVDTRQASTVSGWAPEFHDPGFVAFYAQIPAQDSLDTARATMLATLEGLRNAPVTEAEVDRLQTRTRRQFDEALSDPTRLAIALSESIAAGDWRLYFLTRDRYRALTAADVQRVADTYLKRANRTVAEVVPDAKPDRAPVAAAVDTAVLVQDYKGDPPPAAGEVIDATPAALEARTRRFVLANGMKVALLAKKTRGETVKIAVQVDQGDEQSLFDRSPQGSLAAAMLTRGTATRSRQEIEDALDRLGAKAQAAGTETRTTLTAETVRANLPQTLRLVAEMLREPAFPSAEFTQLQRERLARLETMRKDPDAIAAREFARHGNPYPRGDPRHVYAIDEEIARMKRATVEETRRFHAQFAGGNHGEVAIVGDFDPAIVQAQLEELFGNWRSANPYVRVPEPFVAKAPAALRTETPDRANAALRGGIDVPVSDSHPDFPALLVAASIVGDVGTGRLWKRIRETDGLSYGVYATLHAGSFEPNATFGVQAIYAPENRERLAAALNEELARAVRVGFSDTEVAEAKAALAKQRQLARTQDAVLAAALAQQAHRGRTFDYAAGVDAALAALTTADVDAAFRRHVNPGGLAFAFAGDFAKK